MSKKLWGGRFKKKIDRSFFNFQKSISYDYKLAEYDLLHSLAHVSVLRKASLLTKAEAKKLFSALTGMLKEIKKFKPDKRSEDVHTDIQNRIEKKVGKLALKLHTLRSRNDQIVFDEKWYCNKEAAAIAELLTELGKSLAFIAKKYKDQPFVGYTHTKKAQVIQLRDYFLAFAEMFARDGRRLVGFSAKLFVHIGAGALAGSALDRKIYAEAARRFLAGGDKLKLKLLKNALDNVSDRDFIVELLSTLAIVQMHLSRLAEDFILYSTKEFNFFNLPEEFCTGSSLMPHKKNPDFLELVRGYTGKIYGNLISVLTVMKGLPLAYNRDMQLDKEPLFSSVKIVKDELALIAKFIRKIKLNRDEIVKAMEDESLYATELAEFLVFKGVAFAEAHRIVGKLIRYAEDEKISLRQIDDQKLSSFHSGLKQKEIKKIIKPGYALKAKKSVLRKLPKVKSLKNK